MLIFSKNTLGLTSGEADLQQEYLTLSSREVFAAAFCRIVKVMITSCLFFVASSTLAGSFDHSNWDRLLESHVVLINEGRSTAVDYEGLAMQQDVLKRYLESLSAVKKNAFEQWTKSEQLAFLINAYNAWTVELVLSRYPDLTSIKDIGGFFSSPWTKAFIPLFDSTLTLDDIEHGLIRSAGQFNDPRIHFAVNCASIGCPALRPEAYTGDRLDTQLTEQAHLFMADDSRNRLQGDVLEVSSLFKWYGEDFEKGWLGIHSLTEFFILHSSALGLTEGELDRLKTGKIEFKFLDYDWRLNVEN